ncbi:MAG: DNA recombination protein RmuC [Chitinophagaceae bacterium]|nr:DNA recombination protein RmuC [Chitinophagaceae bacterium]
MISLSYFLLSLALIAAALMGGTFTWLLTTRQRVPAARWQLAQTTLAGAEAQLQACQTQLADARQQATHYRQRFEMQYQQTTALHNELARQQAQAEAQQQRLQEQQQSMQQYGQLLRQEFQLLADEVLSKKSQQFNQQQETKLNDLLQPVRHKLEEFRSELSQKFSAASTERTELKEQVRLMAELNQQLSQQAHNLTRALSSQVKQQGNWGETILETILQHVGLQKDLHYFAQYNSTNHQGQVIRPDFVVRYPDDRYVVIDSKVSLLHYQQYTDAATPAEQQHYKQLLLRSLRQHIDGLSAKQYQHISGALDQVLLYR